MQTLVVHRDNEASGLVRLAVERMAAHADEELRSVLLTGFEDTLERLSGTAAGPLEALLCQDVATCWLELCKLALPKQTWLCPWHKVIFG